MTALRITSEFAAALIGTVLGRLLAERIGLGAIPWPASLTGAVGVTAVSTVRLLRHKRRRDAG
jgi:hypothetical protein